MGTHIDLSGGAGGADIPVYANVAALPVSAAAGDVAVTLSPLDIYIYNGAAWEASTANSFLAGVVAPTTEGQNGDFYLDTVTKYLYLKAGGTWAQQGTVQYGHVIFGVVAPTTEGQNGDYYFDTVTKSIYTKAAGSWTRQGSTQDAHFLSGVVAPTTEGQNGDIYIDILTDLLYLKAAGSWTAVATAQSGHNLLGSGVPASGLGVSDDTYYDTATGILYKKTDATTWVAVTPDATAAIRGLVSTGTQSFAGAKTFTGDVITQGTSTDISNTELKEPSGFIADNIAITYDANTQTVTIPTGTVYYLYGKRYVVGTALTTTHTNATGTYYFYIDVADNTFKSSTVAWEFSQIQVCVAYFDTAKTPKGIALYECHKTMDYRTHDHLHNTIGTFKKSGGAVGGIVIQNSSDVNNNPSVGSSVIVDEDINFTTTQKADNGTWPVYYKNGANWTYNVGATSAYVSGTNFPFYNPFTGSSGALTSCVNGNYVCYFLFVAPFIETAFQHFMIMGQAIHSSLSAAQAYNVSNLNLTGLGFSEFVPIEKFIFRCSNTYGATGQYRIEQADDIIGTRSSTLNVAGTTSPTNHNNLTNRSDASSHPAAAIEPVTTNFGAELSAAESTVQLALDRLDDYSHLPHWVSGSSYRIGNIVIRNNEMWRCLTANSDVTFTIANWRSLNHMSHTHTDVADGATISHTLLGNGAISIAISYGNIGLIITGDKATTLISAPSDPSGVFLATDSGTGLYVYKSAASDVINIKNRTGGTITLLENYLTNAEE